MIRKTVIAVSTALAVLTLAMFVANFWTFHFWDFRTDNRCTQVGFTGGVLGFDIKRFVVRNAPSSGQEEASRIARSRVTVSREFGSNKQLRFYYRRAEYEYRSDQGPGVLREYGMPARLCPNGLTVRIIWLAIPLWALLIVFSACPTVALIRGPLRRHRRRKRNRCVVCGYDLTGNVSGTCPECGEAVQSMQRQ